MNLTAAPLRSAAAGYAGAFGLAPQCSGRLLSRTEPNRVVNPWGSVKQRFGEFRAEIPGSETNLDGCLRTLVRVPRNGERRAACRIGGNPCGKRPKRETPRGEPLGVLR